jgi:hypothetical protein
VVSRAWAEERASFLALELLGAEDEMGWGDG